MGHSELEETAVREKLSLDRARESLKTLRYRVGHEAYSFERLVEKMAEDQALTGGSGFAFIHNTLERLTEIRQEIIKRHFDSWELPKHSSEKNPEQLYSPEKMQIYRNINEKLSEIEKQIKRDSERLCQQCQSMLSDGSIDDYEIRCSICFFLDESDPDFMDADDNILANLKFDLKFGFDREGLDDGENHSYFRKINGHPLQRERHCFLFHQLYDHTGIDWDDLPRIDSVWVDIKVVYQNFYHLKRRDVGEPEA
jgi:hypothetical protein